MRITEPGIYQISAAEYHQDPCPEPSLSASIASLLLDGSPRHAWCAHPRLGGISRPNHQQFDLGHAAHTLLLGDGRAFAIVDAEDWRTKDAREQREAAYASGLIPILRHQYDECMLMVEAARAQLESFEADDVALHWKAGRAEQTMVWREGPVWCRAMADWLPLTGECLYDLKTTSGTAHPDTWGRRLWEGPALQSALYRRGARKLLGWEQPRFRFVVIENRSPYALSVIELDPAAIDLAERMVDAAVALWRQCLERDHWPGYPARVCYAAPPAWIEMRWSERESRAQVLKDFGTDEIETALWWQSPISMGGRS